jgi:hypothetical protein
MKRVDLNQYILILILRTSGLSLEDTARSVGCHVTKVEMAEKWFIGLTEMRAVRYIPDENLKTIVEVHGQTWNIEPDTLARVKTLTRSDLFRRYSRVPPVKGLTPFDESVYKDHQRKLLKTAEAVRDSVYIPNPENFFNAEICQRVDRYSDVECSSHMGLRDGKHFLSFEVENARGKFRLKQIHLGIEDEPLYQILLGHLAEIDLENRIEAYKKELSGLLESCFDLMQRANEECQEATGAEYIGPNNKIGMYYTFPVYLCKFFLVRKEDTTEADLCVEQESANRWRLTDKKDPGLTLALGDEAICIRCMEALQIELKRYSRRHKTWVALRQKMGTVSEHARDITSNIDRLIRRGYFKGNCDACEDYAPEEPLLS